MNTEEFFPPTEEELIEMIKEIEQQLEECDDNDEGIRLSYEKMKLQRKLKKIQDLQNNGDN